MRSIKDLMNGMENDTSPGNMPTSSSGNDDGLCPLCGRESLCDGLGYVRADLPVGHPQFGQLFRCPNYRTNAERKEKLRKLGNLEAYKDKTFESFDTENVPNLSPKQRDSLREALHYAQAYASQPTGWILFEGTYGTDKTHLAAAIGNSLLDHEERVIFVTVPDLLDYLRGAYAPNAESGYDETFDRLREAGVLILDDLGVENPSEWAGEKLFQLLNHRYVYRLPTVVTTNADIETIDPRLASRLADNKLVQHVQIKAPDFRTNKNTSVDEVPDLGLYREMTLENFDTRTRTTVEERSNLERAVQIAREIVEIKSMWLVLIGPSGTGKTHLAAGIANELDKAGVGVIMVTNTELLDYLRSGVDSRVQLKLERRLSILRNVSVLVLDDLNFESMSAWAREKVFQVLDYRYLRRMKTIITSIRSIEEMDARVRTRILDRRRSAVYVLTGRPYVDRMPRTY
ncbi:MAG: ATP-binding protein [Chloroflexi bacterium]|nr:ATP-binding protein [Chloroflexota bacterium]